MTQSVQGAASPTAVSRSRQLLAAPLLAGRRVTLRRYHPNDDGFVAAFSAHPFETVAGRTLGLTPSLVRDIGDLVGSHDVLFTVVRTDDPSEVVGFVGAYAYEARHAHAYLGVYGLDAYRSSALMLDATLLTLEYLFFQLGLRWVYADMTEWSYAEIARGEQVGQFFEVQGRRPEYFFHQGRWWERVEIGFSRRRWTETRSRWLRYLLSAEDYLGVPEMPELHVD